MPQTSVARTGRSRPPTRSAGRGTSRRATARKYQPGRLNRAVKLPFAGSRCVLSALQEIARGRSNIAWGQKEPPLTAVSIVERVKAPAWAGGPACSRRGRPKEGDDVSPSWWHHVCTPGQAGPRASLRARQLTFDVSQQDQLLAVLKTHYFGAQTQTIGAVNAYLATEV